MDILLRSLGDSLIEAKGVLLDLKAFVKGNDYICYLKCLFNETTPGIYIKNVVSKFVRSYPSFTY